MGGGGSSSSSTMENLQNTLPPKQVIIPDESATGQVVLNEAAAKQAQINSEYAAKLDRY